MKSAKHLALLLTILGLAALPLSAATTGHFERTLKVSGNVDLDVASGSGNITVHTGSSDTVYVSAKIHAGNSWLFGGNPEEKVRRIEQNPPVEQTGNIIHIGRNEDHDLFRNISIDYDLTVPAQTHLTFHSIHGALFAQNGSGNIHAEGVAGEVVANSGSGDVEVHQVGASGSVRAETGSGNIKLHGVKGGLRADAGSGDIQAEGEPTSDWRLGAGSGNITLRVPAQAN